MITQGESCAPKSWQFALKAQLFTSFCLFFFACSWHRNSAWVGKGPQVPAEHKVSGAAGSGSYICIIKPFHSTNIILVYYTYVPVYIQI